RGFVAAAVTLVFVIGAITTMVAARRRDHDESRGGEAVAQVAPKPDGVAVPSGAQGAPATVTVAIRANIPCIVYKGDKELTRSGSTLPLRRGEQVTLTCRAEGYEDDPETFIPDETTHSVDFRLQPKRSHTRAGKATRPAEKTPALTQEPAGETLPNPYRKP